MRLRDRHRPWVRGIVAAAALTMTAGGVPMCTSILAHALAPCSMHTEHADHEGAVAHHAHGPAVSAAPTEHETCHDDPQSHGCLSSGACPSTGALAPAMISETPVMSALTLHPGLLPGPAHTSFLVAPVPPPPRA